MTTITPELQAQWDLQTEAGREMMETLMNIAHESGQETLKTTLVQWKGHNINNAAFDEYTKAGDFVMRQQGAILQEDQQKMGQAEIMLPSWKPATQVVDEAWHTESDPNIDSPDQFENLDEAIEAINEAGEAAHELGESLMGSQSVAIATAQQDLSQEEIDEDLQSTEDILKDIV